MSKLLVVEDDIFLSKVYKLKLVQSGYDVISLVNGKGVLEKVKKEKPDLILLDLIMPEKDGFTVLKELKADPETRDYHVLILSNLAQKDDIKAGMDLGADDYYVKSNVSFKEVLSEIKKYVG